MTIVLILWIVYIINSFILKKYICKSVKHAYILHIQTEHIFKELSICNPEG